MKLPYRQGDSFALPLGDGRTASSCVVHCEHRLAIIALGDPVRPLAVLRASDDALVLHRWKIEGHRVVPRAYEPENHWWISAARAEREAAARLGVAHLRTRARRVIEVRDDVALDPPVGDDTILTLTTALSAARLDALSMLLANHSGVTLRLLGPSLGHLAVLAPHVRRLAIGAPFGTLPPLANLTTLEVHAPGEIRAVVASAPNLRALAWRAPAQALDPRALEPLRALRTLELSGIEVRSDLFPALRALRLVRTRGLRVVPQLRSLQSLSLEHLHDLTRLDALARCSSLEQLELRGLWQFNIPDVEWMLDQPRLLRAEIDIGGRRKNVELYRRANWAYPWRFPGIAGGG